MKLRTVPAFAAGAVVAVVLGTGTTYAANGGHFVLGRTNSETSYSTLSNSLGTALVLRSKAGTPSLRVSDTTKVPKLNADLVDGVDSEKLARVTRIGTVAGDGFVDTAGTADPGDDAVVAVAVCPSGSQVVGGGGADLTDDGVLFWSAPDGQDAWVVVSDTATVTAGNAANVTAFARCFNPRSDVASTARQAPAPHRLTAQARAAIGKVTARR